MAVEKDKKDGHDILVRHILKQHSIFSQWLILSIALIIIGCIISLNIFLEYEHARNREQERLLAQTKILQENIGQNLIATRDVLVGLRQYLPKGRTDKDLLNRLQILTDAIPGIRTLAIIDASGTWQASNRKEFIGKTFSQRDYFQIPRQQPDDKLLYVTSPYKSQLGSFTISVSVVIPGPKGKFAGVVMAGLDPSYFAPLLDSVRYSPDMRTGIIHWDGDVFMIIPARINIAGKSLAKPNAFFTMHKDSGQTTNVFTGATAATGEERMVTFCTVKPKKLKLDKPLIVTASRDPGEIFAAWRKDSRKFAALYGVIVLISILGLYAFQRRQRQFNKQSAEAANALKQSEERFRSFVENANDIIYSLNPDGVFTYVSPNWKEILGHNVSEVEGHNFAIFVHPDDLPGCLVFLEKALVSGEKQAGIEYRVLHKNGNWRWHTSNAAIIRDPAKNTVSFIGIARDITDRKEAEIERDNLITQLQEALAKVKTLSGFLPICSFCKKIRDDSGYWNQLESYISEHSDALFSHSYCPECAEKYRNETGNIINKRKE